LSIKTYLST